jgi:hypothetical protein
MMSTESLRLSKRRSGLWGYMHGQFRCFKKNEESKLLICLLLRFGDQEVCAPITCQPTDGGLYRWANIGKMQLSADLWKKHFIFSRRDCAYRRLIIFTNTHGSNMGCTSFKSCQITAENKDTLRKNTEGLPE